MLQSASLRRIAIAFVCVSGASCAVETIVHDLNEREANRILEILADNEIDGTKTVIEGREVTYTVAVPAKARIDAIRILNYYEMPRRRDRGYTEVFKEAGLIPTSAEEKAKQLSAVEGEIERQIKIIDGIIDVQVQLVAPEESALRTTQDQHPPTTASVTVKYIPGAGGSKPLSEPQIQSIVAGGVESLTPENVVVVMTPASKVMPGKPGEVLGAPGGSRRTSNILLTIAMVAVVIFGLFLAFSQVQLNRTRGRLTRLQDQIQKARKKPLEAPAEGAPAGGEAQPPPGA